MKALYRHKESGDIFAIEMDETGDVVSTAGPLLSKELDPNKLAYDNYFTPEIRAKIADFERLSRADYLQLLRDNGFVIDSVQKQFWE